MKIFKKNAQLYNNVKAVLQSAGRPLTMSELKNHADIYPHWDYETKINDVLRAYRNNGMVRKLPPVFGNNVLYEWITADVESVKLPVGTKPLVTPVEVPPSLVVQKSVQDSVPETKSNKPEILVEKDRIIINHHKCRIVVEFD